MRPLEQLIAASTPEPYRRITDARGINNFGQIVAQSGPSGTEAVLLTPFVVGDLDCDAQVTPTDYLLLELLLRWPRRYQRQYPDCPGPDAGDVNQDGVTDERDLALLGDLVCPCPDLLAWAAATAAVCPADLNDDGRVDLADLAELLARLGTAARPVGAHGDLDADGDVDADDLSLMLARFGTTCP